MGMIKVFVGTSQLGMGDEIAEKTLEYSLKKHSSLPLECIFMRNDNDPDNPFSGFNCKSWATPFSGLRWAIPEVCNFKGRAIYMDVDQLSVHDIAELWDIDMQGKQVAQISGRSCVMLLDCEKLKSICVPIADLKKDSKSHMLMYRRMRESNILKIDPRWNNLDGRGAKGPEDIYHLHFTHMASQPWKPKWFKGKPNRHVNPWCVKLWEQYRDEMLAQ